MNDLFLNNNFEMNKSVIHRMNPSLKLLCTLFLLIIVFLPIGVFGYAILLIVTSILWKIAKMSRDKMFSILKSIALLLVIIFIVNWIAYKVPSYKFDISASKHLLGFSWEQVLGFGWTKLIPDTSDHYWICSPLWGGWVGEITKDQPHNTEQFVTLGTLNGITYYLPYKLTWYTLSPHILIVIGSIALRIYLMIVIISLLINTTTTIELTFAIQDMLKPLGVLKIPVNEWAMTISIAIRFVPNLLNESQRIMKAQASRGVDFKNGSFINKIKSIASLVVPMFSIAFKKADELADAMEARGYNPRKVRTRYRNYLTRWFDWIFVFFFALLLSLLIAFACKHTIFGPFFLVDVYLI